VPAYWVEHAEAWLKRDDSVPLDSEPKPVDDALERNWTKSQC